MLRLTTRRIGVHGRSTRTENAQRLDVVRPERSDIVFSIYPFDDTPKSVGRNATGIRKTPATRRHLESRETKARKGLGIHGHSRDITSLEGVPRLLRLPLLVHRF